MCRFEADLDVRASADEILRVLADPDRCRCWSPVPFEVRELDSPQLETGASALVGGEVLGREVSFKVDIEEASTSLFSLHATNGGVCIDVRYELSDCGNKTELRAEVVTHGSGLGGRVVAAGIDAVIRAGALRLALQNIAAEAEAAGESVAWAA